MAPDDKFNHFQPSMKAKSKEKEKKQNSPLYFCANAGFSGVHTLSGGPVLCWVDTT